MASTNEKASVLVETKLKNSKNAKPDEHDYAKRPQRVTREELFIILAFWMGESPLTFPQTEDKTLKTKTKLLNGVGAVLINPDNKIFALDCSRKNGLCVTHGVIRLLMKFPRHAQRSTLYCSRKPCSRCTKMLVQCKVAKVFYLPIPPEVNDEDDIKKVDHLFKVSEVAQSVFVPNINDSSLGTISDDDYIEQKAQFSPIREDIKQNRQDEIERWKKLYWNYDEWVNSRLKESLPWLAFDENMEKQVSFDMKSMFEWISFAAIIDPSYDTKFKMTGDKPEPSQSWQKLALHSIRLAKIVSLKTDDPCRGVGAVIMMNDESIVAIGWNGFPSKALYGDFPRASRNDSSVRDKKYPYVIHAEQNALLMRNKDDIRDNSTTLFVNKAPCNECAPLLFEAGVKKVVVPIEKKKDSSAADIKSDLGYDLFHDEIFGFEIYRPYSSPIDVKSITPSEEKKKDLTFQ